jgi:hypothetical protein
LVNGFGLLVNDDPGMFDGAHHPPLDAVQVAVMGAAIGIAVVAAGRSP